MKFLLCALLTLLLDAGFFVPKDEISYTVRNGAAVYITVRNNSPEKCYCWWDENVGISDRSKRIRMYLYTRKGDFSFADLVHEYGSTLVFSGDPTEDWFIKELASGDTFTFALPQRALDGNNFLDRIVVASQDEVESALSHEVPDILKYKGDSLFVSLTVPYGKDIVYSVPDEVEKEVYGYMRHCTRREPWYFEFILNEYEDNYFLYCFVSKDSVSIGSACSRKLLVNGNLYPLSLQDYDDPFYEREPDSLKEFGARRGRWPDGSPIFVRRYTMICGAEYVKFDKRTFAVANPKYSKYARGKSGHEPQPCTPRQQGGVCFISDDVEAEAYAYMQYARRHCRDSLSFKFILTELEDRYRMYAVAERQSGDAPVFDIGETDRYLLVNEELVPLYFDTDFIFASGADSPAAAVFTGPHIDFRKDLRTVMDREYTGPWKLWE